MKRFLILGAIIWSAVFLVPFMGISKDNGTDVPILPLPTEGIGESAEVDKNISVTLSRDGKVETLSLSEYLEGVVAAEMPALFPEEALKAQAVAARTYTMKRLTSPAAKEHNGAAVCSNPARV